MGVERFGVGKTNIIKIVEDCCVCLTCLSCQVGANTVSNDCLVYLWLDEVMLKVIIIFFTELFKDRSFDIHDIRNSR